MDLFTLPNSVLVTKRAAERSQSLVSMGKSFDLEGPYDFAPILKWMKDAYEVLAHFPEERDQFGLFCLNSYAFPKHRVEWGVQILEKALRKLTSDERPTPCPSIPKESVCRGGVHDELLQAPE
jgi:hypothetical protein